MCFVTSFHLLFGQVQIYLHRQLTAGSPFYNGSHSLPSFTGSWMPQLSPTQHCQHLILVIPKTIPLFFLLKKKQKKQPSQPAAKPLSFWAPRPTGEAEGTAPGGLGQQFIQSAFGCRQDRHVQPASKLVDSYPKTEKNGKNGKQKDMKCCHFGDSPLPGFWVKKITRVQKTTS